MVIGRAIHLGVLVVLIFVLACSCSLESDALEFSPDQVPAASVGVPYAATITVRRNRGDVFGIAVVSGVLPRGIILDYARGRDTANLAGIPEEAGVFSFVVWAGSLAPSGPSQEGEKQYRLVVVP